VSDIKVVLLMRQTVLVNENIVKKEKWSDDQIKEMAIAEYVGHKHKPLPYIIAALISRPKKAKRRKKCGRK
jgi:hypothetical protein